MSEKRIMKSKKKISSSNQNAFESKLLMNYPQILKDYNTQKLRKPEK